MPVLTDELNKMNTSVNRTHVENLMLKEMVEEDRDDLLNEDAAFDAIVPDNSLDNGLFGDSSSDSFEDTIGTPDELEGFTMTELF